MGKTSKRVWSLVLSILMVLSMASVFCLPTMAAASNELDYDALRTGADTFVINNAWTADDLVAGNTVSYYFKGQTYEETYDANRHFASWADCYAVYSSKINETNIGSYVPTFIFAPGTYSEQILLHTNANILGSNAGINPSDTSAEWTLSAMNEGWATNPAWDTTKETVINAEILLTGRNSKAQQNSDSSGNYVAAQADAYWQYFLEKYDAANGKTAFVNVIDGVALASNGCFTASYYDIGYKAFNKDGSDSVTATGYRNVDTYFQNGYFRSPGKGIAKYWDSARNISSAHLINMRLEGNTVNGLFQKYMKSVEFDGCYFTNFTNALFGNNANNTAFSWTNSTGVYTTINTEQSIVMKNSVFYNNNAWGWLTTGFGKNILAGISSVKQVMTVENNIFHNATKSSGMWGVFVPYNTNPACTVELNILNNQFVQTSDVSTLSSLINLNYDYQQAPVNITVRGNKFIGSMNLLGNNPDDAFTADELAVLKGSLRLDYGDNFWADTEADVGKPITHLNGSTSGGYANGFDFADATYYFDSAMTISSAALNITAVEGLGNTVTIGRDSINAICSGATGKVTPVFTVAEGSTTAIFTDAECTQEISEIDYDAIENKGTFYVKVTAGEFTKVYSLTITTAIVKEFSEALDAGEINGFDPDITFVYVPAEDGQTVYSFWDGEYYGFTVDNEYVYNSLSAIKSFVQSDSFDDATGKVILPGFEYGRLTVDFSAEFYGTNYKVNPVNKPETVAPTLWTLSEDWDAAGATGIKGITVPAGFAGKIVFNGIELRDKYDASARNSADACADVTFNNVVVDFKNIPGYNYSLEFGSKDGRPAADAFRLYNVFFKNLGSSGNRRFISEGHPSVIDVDNMFWDGLISSTNGAAGWAKNSGNRNLSYSVKNSMIANVQAPAFFQFEPQNEVASDSAQEYTVDFANNIFINENERAAGTTFLSFNAAVGKRFTGISITGNTFYNANGKSIAIGANTAANFDGINEANKLKAENVVVDNNNFIGCVNDQFAIGKFNALTNNFRTPDMNTEGAVGVGTGYDKDGVYFVDLARAAKNTDMEIVSVDAGTSQAEGIVFNKAARTLTFRLLSGSTAGMNIVLPEGATGKWVDAQGNESAVVNFTDLTELSSMYKYVVTNKGYDYPYAVEIANYVPKDFVGNYVCESGLITDKALLVTPLAADLASGAKLNYKWDGMVYDFYAGTNAFATLDDALSYAGANNIEVPEVLLTYWANPAVNLEINRAVKIFAPNYNTKPYIGTLDENNPATATNGENWVENPEFMANQVVVSHIVIGADVSTKEVAIYGLTMTNRFIDTARAASEAATKLSLVNTMMNAPTASNYLFDVNNANARTETQIDELYVKNLYIKTTGGASRLIGENVTCKTTFDGLWIDAKETKFDQQCAYIKCNAKDYTFTIKNSNLRNFSSPTGGVKFFQFQGYIGNDTRIATEEENRWLVFENNILDKFYNAVGGGNVRYMFKWFPAGFNGLKFNNNYMACPADTTGNVRFFHSSIPTDNRTEENMEKVKVSVELTGNVFNGYSSALAISDGGDETRYPNTAFTVENNFWIDDYAEDLDSAVGNMPSISKACHYNTDIGNFWLDRAMTKPSDKLYEYTLTNDNAKYFANTASKVLKYKLDENDEKVTVEETTDGFKYTVDMSGFISENVYNSISLVNGEQSADISKPLVFTLAEKADSLKLNLTVSSPDRKTVTETYTLYIASEFKDAGIDSVTVGDSDVAFSADKNAYAVILPADGVSEAITVTPSAGSEATVTDADGNVVTAVGADVKCTPVEYTITVSNADSTETFTLSVVREHRWNEGEVTTAPTCTEKGVKTFTCLDDETHTYTAELDVIGHDLGDFVIDKEPTCTEKGSKSKHCSMCGEKFEVTEIDMIDHTWNDGEVTKAPTCSAVGEKTFTCSVCQGTKTEEIAIDPDAHEWDTEFTVDLEPTCSAPGSKSIHCKHNDEHRKDVTAIEADASKHVWDEGEVTKAPTCMEEGEKLFTCSECQQTKTEKIDIDPNAHDYDVVTTPATCEKDGSIVKTCKHNPAHVETEVLEAIGHDWDEGVVTTEPTCEEKGVRTFTCKNDKTHTRTEEIEALGHTYDEGVVTTAPTCSAKGVKTFTCSVCQGTKTEEIAIDPNAHDYEVVTTPATCEKDGSIVKTCKHNQAHVETEVLEAIGHDWDEGVVTTEPTCEKKGVRTFTCKNDKTHTRTEEIEALGHKWDDGVVTKAATCTEKGEKTFTCSVCQHTRTEEIAVDPEAHKWGEYVYNNDATTENDGTKTRKCELCGKEETVVAEGTKLPSVVMIDSNEYFPDIKADRENRDKDRWYKPYVDYVATYKLMNGMADGTFAPNNVLTRAEFAQILANMSGVDTSNRDVTTQFTDVPAGKWYSAAIKWAAENGIVNGVSATEFDPNAKIQRQHVCLMLVRYAEKFGIELEAINEKVTFADDAEIGNSSKDAVYACQQAGIVTGKTETTFAPKDSATRAEIATFVTRYHKIATAK